MGYEPRLQEFNYSSVEKILLLIDDCHRLIDCSTCAGITQVSVVVKPALIDWYARTKGPQYQLVLEDWQTNDVAKEDRDKHLTDENREYWRSWASECPPLTARQREALKRIFKEG